MVKQSKASGLKQKVNDYDHYQKKKGRININTKFFYKIINEHGKTYKGKLKRKKSKEAEIIRDENKYKESLHRIYFKMLTEVHVEYNEVEEEIDSDNLIGES